MSALTSIDRIKLEKFLGMGSGYVANFSDRTFGDFVLEYTGIDVYANGYDSGGTSKANRLRTFWKNEPDHVAGKLTKALLEYSNVSREEISQGFGTEYSEADKALYQQCLKIADALLDGASIAIEVFEDQSDDAHLSVLAKSIRESVKSGKPDHALDRLHTFVTRFLRNICTKHEIAFTKETPLHSLIGGYIKFLKDSGAIETEMSERILKSSISILESFNDVRNNKSFAHDNPTLNYEESVLVFNSISNILRFISSIEKKLGAKDTETDWDKIVDLGII